MSYFPGGRNCGDPELAAGRNRRALTTDDLTSLVDDAANYAGQSFRSSEDSAESAALSRNAADDSEAFARTSQEWAEASEDSATSASGSAAVAVGAKNSALGAADSASDSADDAAASALAAAGSEEGVEADRIAAENARTEAVSAKTGAETAQAGSEAARKGAEDAANLALAGQLLGSVIPEAGVDFNTLRTPGVYRIGTVAASASTNMPVKLPGVLLVFYVSSTANAIQRFTPWASTAALRVGEYTRSAASSSVWDSWRFVAPQRVDQTAGRAIYTWDDVNNRDQLIYGDTGIRDVTAAVAATVSVTQGTVRLTRKGSLVNLAFDNFIYQDMSSSNFASLSGLLTPGFRPAFTARHPMTAGRNAAGQCTLYTDGRVTVEPASAFAQYAVIAFTTQDAWPTSLPGVAVGTIPNA